MPPILRQLLPATRSGLPVLRSLLAAGLARTFGRPPFDPGRDPGDPGLHGPGSSSWRVIGDAAAIVGGVRALLVQLLHPLAMAGVHDHSAFRDDSLGRLQRTSAYVAATTYGSTAQALAVASRVRAAHRQVRGRAGDGRAYRAGDPRLLTWVSVALTSSFLAADRAYARAPVGGPDADAFVAEQARAAALLDPRVDLQALAGDAEALAALRVGRLPLPLLDEGALPQTTGELGACLAGFEPELAVGAQAEEALRFLCWPDVPPLLRAGYLPLLGGAIAVLDPRQRARLGLPASRLAVWPLEANAAALLAGFRLAGGASPSRAAAEQRLAARPRVA